MSFKFKLLTRLLLASIFLFVFSSFAFAKPSASQSVAGYWQTIDGKTKKPSSVIHLYSQKGYFFGKVVKAYPLPDEQKTSLCIHCKGAQKNKPIIGMTIIKNMVCEQGQCRRGTILDPRSGNVYHATMHLINSGRQIRVRGYVGIALFGKSVTWNRVSKIEAQ